MTIRVWLLIKSVLLCFVVSSAAFAQDGAAPPLSLADLDALIEQDNETAPTFDQRGLIDLLALIAFLTLAVVSFLKKNTTLKYATMVVAIAYMGFMKGNLVSVVHIFALMEWSFPLFQYNVAWYVLMLFTVVSTVLWGRLYCGRICAFGSLTQLMDRLLHSRWRVELPPWLERRAIYVKYVLLVGVLGYFLVTKDNSVYKYVEPFWMFTLSGSTVMWTLLAALLVTTIFIRNFYCRYLCIVGAGLGLLSNLTIFGIKRWQQCNTCKICENACEWGAIQGPKISVTECVRCDDCEILYDDEDKCPHWLMLKKTTAKLEASKAP
ncbi:MAG: 4Fe-4S binding protein [Rhodospirillaceae bacterium]|nr:4Fe-4S binding protein [Rhodospirillaceae bacterium]